MWWFITGLISTAVFFGAMYLLIGREEFFEDFESPITVGNATEFSLWILAGIIAGPFTTVALVVMLLVAGMDSDIVLWEPKKK